MNDLTGSFIDMLRTGDYIILDTETTGLEHRSEIVQIAIIDSAGNTLLDTLVKPVRDIPPGATNIHHITTAMCANAPSWPVVMHDVAKIISGRNLVIYNAVYDRSMMHRSAEAHGLLKTEWSQMATWWCAMESFARIYGEWNEYRQSYRWQKLTTAAAYYGVPTVNAHSALGDCLMTLGVCRAMAETAVS